MKRIFFEAVDPNDAFDPKEVNDCVLEIKRMWTADTARGLNIFKKMFDGHRDQVIKKSTLGYVQFIDALTMIKGEVNKKNFIKSLRFVSSFLPSISTLPEEVFYAFTNIPQIVETITQQLGSESYVKPIDPDDDVIDIKTDPEAPEDAPLGQYAFPDERWNERLPKEKNTPEENKLQKSLDNHFGQERNAISPAQTAMMKDFLEKGWYSDIFRAPDVNVIYRGMLVKHSWIKNAVKQKSLNINDGEIEASFTFKPRKSVSSWTGDEVVAGDFAYKGYAKEENMFGVILYARVSDNPGILLSGDAGMYRLGFAEPFDHEDEVIAMGTVNVFMISFKKQT